MEFLHVVACFQGFCVNKTGGKKLKLKKKATYLGRHPYPAGFLSHVRLCIDLRKKELRVKLSFEEFSTTVVFAITFHLRPCKGILSF